MLDNYIGFHPDLVPLVLNGSKVITYRLNNKYENLKPGELIKVRNSDTNEIFGEVEIISNNKVLFRDLPFNQKGHEVYQSKEDQRNTFKKYYNRDISDDEVVVVLQFKLTRSLIEN